MESILSLIVNAENGRMLLMLVFGFSGFVWLRTSIKSLEYKTESSMKNLEHKTGSSIKELEYKMEALTTRMDGSFKALTYVLEKNDTLSKEDKEYVDNQLYGQLPVAASL